MLLLLVCEVWWEIEFFMCFRFSFCCLEDFIVFLCRWLCLWYGFVFDMMRWFVCFVLLFLIIRYGVVFFFVEEVEEVWL